MFTAGRSVADPERKEKLCQILARQGYVLDAVSFATRRPDHTPLAFVSPRGASVIAKIYPDEGGERAFRNMQKLWHSSFGERRQPPGLPRPLDYLPDAGVLIMERLEGRPLAEMSRPQNESFDQAIRLLTALHDCDAQPDARRTARGIVRSAQRKAARIAERAPQYADSIRTVVEALAAARPKDSELVPSHGDCSPRNVLVGRNRVALIDWDRFQWADPCRDLAYLATWDWRFALQRGRRPDGEMLDRAVALYRAARPSAVIGRQLRFHVAAGLLRMACSLVELWPEEAYLVPALTQVALRQLR
jgi:hypothetical protein